MKTSKIVACIVALLLVFTLITAFLPGVVTTVDAQAQAYTYEDKILVRSQVNTVEITMDPADFEDLLNNPLNETYYTANVTINGYSINNAALRTKGNNSLTTVASDADSDRYSFKVDFDYYQDQSLFGLTKLCLNNCYNDTSFMKEFLSYSLMEEMGVPTPAFAYTYIYINGEEWGLYLGVEAVNETFLAANFSDGTGDLYKPDGTTLAIDADELEQSLSRLNIKTNENTSDHSALSELLEVINNGGDLESVLNVDEVIRYFAVNTALVSMDSYQGSTLHNYYLYEEDGVFSIIPWDYDLSFGAFNMGGGMGGRGDQDQWPGGNGAQQGDENAAEDNQNSDLTPDAAGDNMPAEGVPPDDLPAMGDNFDPGGMGGPGREGDMEIPEDFDPSAFQGQMEMGEGREPGQGAANRQEDQVDAESGTPESETPESENEERAPADINQGGQGRGGFGGGLGQGQGGMSASLSDDTINFPIDTPVSGYDVEQFPLVNSWLQEDEYKELYHQYLEEIATGFFSEARITVMVGDIAKLISNYVAADPNNNSSTEDFTNEFSNLITFCTERSESILAQLDGTVDSEKEATGSSMMRMGMGGGGGMDQAGQGNLQDMMDNMTDEERAAMEEQAQELFGEDFDLSQFQDENGDLQFPGFNAMGAVGGGGDMGDIAGRGGMGFGGSQGSSQSDPTSTIQLLLGCGAVLLLAIIIAMCFKRRGRNRNTW